MLVNITINGKALQVPAGYTILKAASENGIYIPRLCFLEGIHEESSCRVCVVEIQGQRTLKNACTFQVFENMVVKTNTPKVKDAVKQNLELVAANHVFECWKCVREHNCELLDLLRKYNVENKYGENPVYSKKERHILTSDALTIDSGKCTLCGRCVSACEKLAGTSVLGFNKRGSQTIVGPALLHSIEDSGCIYCGKCIQACPVGALRETTQVEKVEQLLDAEEKFLVIQAAPAVRAALGEEFGLPIGTNVEGKMYQAFKQLGFNEIVDVNWAADLTIMEEGTELLERIENNGTLPLFTSCSPGWIRYIEQYQPSYLENLSSCKSPNQMCGAMVKHYLAPKLNVKPEDVVVVSVMPCIAKKSEAKRSEMEFDGIRDVDYVLTTRELAALIKRRGIDFVNLEDYKPTSPLAEFTGAGNIFGATGGVMEAAIRTVAEILEGKELDSIDYEVVRGNKEIKEATVILGGKEINVAVVHGGKAIKEFFEILEKGEKQYHFVEFMGCVGGCINGGGQPIVKCDVLEKVDVKALRAKALYDQDANMPLRKSHKNESVMKAYEEFLGKPGSHKAHDLLHTHYSAKDFYSEE